MAVRRFNYTDRQRINKEDARITVYENEGGAASFDANIDLTSCEGLPGGACVFVEASRQMSFMRFSYGTVDRMLPPTDRRLTEFDSVEGVLFRVRVSSSGTSSGLLLAEASEIRPRSPQDTEDNRIPLLPVVPSPDLDRQLFRIDFDDYPKILVNTGVGDWQETARHPVFVSLVFPAAVREILTRILVVEKYYETDDLDDWKSRWLIYATRLPGITITFSEGEESETYLDWIDDVVDSFCRRFEMLNQYIQYQEGDRS